MQKSSIYFNWDANKYISTFYFHVCGLNVPFSPEQNTSHGEGGKALFIYLFPKHLDSNNNSTSPTQEPDAWILVSDRKRRSKKCNGGQIMTWIWAWKCKQNSDNHGWWPLFLLFSYFNAIFVISRRRLHAPSARGSSSPTGFSTGSKWWVNMISYGNGGRSWRYYCTVATLRFFVFWRFYYIVKALCACMCNSWRCNSNCKYCFSWFYLYRIILLLSLL